MTELESQPSDDLVSTRGRLPAPGCLLAVTVPLVVVAACFWIGVRAHRQQVPLKFFDEIGADVQTEPATPRCSMISSLANSIKSTRRRSQTSLSRVFYGSEITDDGLQHLSGITSLTATT